MATIPDPRHRRHMAAALGLARRGLGVVWPNPAVGCILVADGGLGAVVARGWTQPGGRPHAETEALARAGALARGTAAYVTLEPCAHVGETPPCCDALIAAGIARAVVALEDPDPRVSGRGLERLRAADIDVVPDVGRDEATEINLGFITRVTRGRPLITLKTATTLDGRIATHSGESRWITNELARTFAHRLRANHDAVMVGVATALSDNPELTCRLPGLADRSPVRIVIDSRLRLPLTCRLVETAARRPTWVVTLAGADADRARAYRDVGIELIEAPAGETGTTDLAWTFQELGRRGLTRVLVEGGGRLAAALLGLGLVDRIAWFRAPRLMGGDGVAAAAPFGVDHLSQTPRFVRRAIQAVGPDVLETYAREDQEG